MGDLHMEPVLEQETDAAEVQTAHSGHATAKMSRGHGNGLSAGGSDASAEMGGRQEDSPFASGKDTFFARSAFQQNSSADAGEVKHSVPQGSEQGGFLDWIQGAFGGGAGNRDAAMQENLVNGEQQKYQGAEPEQRRSKWVEDDYGKVKEENVTYLPERSSVLSGYMHDTDIEGPAQNPVFETHAIAPREAVDGIGWSRLHSFVGLRFTKYDENYGVRRKHIKVGFGSKDGVPFGAGGLRNDWENQADASTETPISKGKLEELIARIPQVANERRYNVLTYNCAHFAKEMAEIAGASVPAEMQKSLLGPAGANKKIAAAATQGEQEDGTRIFHGGAAGKGELAAGNRHKLTSGFYETAKSAARWDATPFLLYRELEGNARSMADATAQLGQYLSETTKLIQKREDAEAVESTIREVNERGKKLIATRTLVSHPRVNMAAMKALTLAKEVESIYSPKRHLATNGVDEFYHTGSFMFRTTEEFASNNAENERKEAIRRSGLPDKEIMERLKKVPRIGSSNQAYFGGLTSYNNGQIRSDDQKRNFEEIQKNRKITGELFIEAAGLTPEVLLRQAMGVGEGLKGGREEQARVNEIVKRIGEGLEANRESSTLGEYLKVYVRYHPHLSRSQIAATITGSMLEQLMTVASAVKNGTDEELGSLQQRQNGVAAKRAEGSLDMDGEDVQTYLKEQLEVEDETLLKTDLRMQALKQTNQIERFLVQRMNELMGEEAPITELVPDAFLKKEKQAEQKPAEQAQAVEVLAAAPVPEQVLNAPEAPAQADEAAVELMQQRKKTEEQ